MLFQRERKRVPALNTTSTADISFMLLILFLVTTSMDIDKGLSRQLPPLAPEQESPVTDVKEGTVLTLQITDKNVVLCNDEPLTVSQLQQKVMQHVAHVGKDHVVQLSCSRSASYDTYFQVQNAIVSAYNSLRDSRARQLFNRSYASCNEDQQRQLREAIPQRVAEIYQTKGEEP